MKENLFSFWPLFSQVMPTKRLFLLSAVINYTSWSSSVLPFNCPFGPNSICPLNRVTRGHLLVLITLPITWSSFGKVLLVVLSSTCARTTGNIIVQIVFYPASSGKYTKEDEWIHLSYKVYVFLAIIVKPVLLIVITRVRFRFVTEMCFFF